mgnify:CR=1 FL=1
MKFNKYNDCYNIIGTKLKEIREEQNISQYELSNKLALLGITLYQSDIFKIEKNQRTVRDFELWGICKVLNVKAEELFSPNK